MLDKIDMAVCLLLDQRMELWEPLWQQAKMHGINLQYFLAGDGHLGLGYHHIDSNEQAPVYDYSTDYSTWWKYPHAYNAWKCHRKIIEGACRQDVQLLLLMEDDAIFEEDFAAIWENVQPFLSENPWDMLYLGAYHNPSTIIKIHKNLLRIHGSAGWHAVIMNAPVMKEILSFPPLGPMDWMAGQIIHQRYNCYAVFPSIVTQKSGYSYIEEGNLTKPPRNKI